MQLRVYQDNGQVIDSNIYIYPNGNTDDIDTVVWLGFGLCVASGSGRDLQRFQVW